MVIGAVIHLGYCFDLLESHSLSVLKAQHQALSTIYATANLDLPKNEPAYGKDTDKLMRKLDCAVFQPVGCAMRTDSRKEPKLY